MKMLKKYRYEVRTFRGFKGCTDLAISKLTSIAMLEELQREGVSSEFWWACVIDLETGLKLITTSDVYGVTHTSGWLKC